MLTGFLEPARGPAAPRPVAVDAARATTYELRVRFSDVDVYRHVNNVKYVEYLQEARIAHRATPCGATPTPTPPGWSSAAPRSTTTARWCCGPSRTPS